MSDHGDRGRPRTRARTIRVSPAIACADTSSSLLGDAQPAAREPTTQTRKPPARSREGVDLAVQLADLMQQIDDPDAGPPSLSCAEHALSRLAFAKNPYNPRIPLDPGRELNGRPPYPSVPAGPAWSGVPCSRLQSIRAFPEGLEGLGAGEDGPNRGKAFHAALRTRLSCAPGRQRAAGRGADRAVHGRHRAGSAARSPRTNTGASSRSPTASARTARRTSRCSTSTRRRRRSPRSSARSASTKTCCAISPSASTSSRKAPRR